MSYVDHAAPEPKRPWAQIGATWHLPLPPTLYLWCPWCGANVDARGITRRDKVDAPRRSSEYARTEMVMPCCSSLIDRPFTIYVDPNDGRMGGADWIPPRPDGTYPW